MIITIKPPGCTINDHINKIKEEHNITKMCYCGRLDPMARGKLLLLVDDECKKINNYLNSKKQYQFEIIFNIQTDSDDPLGIIEQYKNDNVDIFTKKYLLELLKVYNTMSFSQNFHQFSSKPVYGKPLWYYKKNNIHVTLPSHPVEIYKLVVGKEKNYKYDDWRNKIISQIDSINKEKDFNQEFIINQWKETEMNNLISIPVQIDVSSGFYVRQFVRDLSDKIKYPLLTFDINRTNIYY